MLSFSVKSSLTSICTNWRSAASEFSLRKPQISELPRVVVPILWRWCRSSLHVVRLDPGSAGVLRKSRDVKVLDKRGLLKRCRGSGPARPPPRLRPGLARAHPRWRLTPLANAQPALVVVPSYSPPFFLPLRLPLVCSVARPPAYRSCRPLVIGNHAITQLKII